MDRNLPILVAEDSETDAILFQKALDELGLQAAARFVADGREAVAYLSGTGEYEDRLRYPFPRVFFTDLKMPRMDGFGVLRWMRQNPAKTITPTIMLSSSTLEEDVKTAYELGASAYMVKPTRFEDLQEMLMSACQFWSRCAKPQRLEHAKW